MTREDTYDTHAFPGSDQGSNANKETNSGEGSPTTTGVAESYEGCGGDATNDTAKTKATGEDDARTVAVANSPADEVGVGLMAERPLNGVYHVMESGRMSCIGQCM